nr:PepSY domain-containing protein [uncultured Roseococcus sp.]
MLHRFTPLMILGCVAVMLAPGPGQARGGHASARAALEAGQIRPLSELMTEVEQRYLGRVIEVELERSDGRWQYEIKILPPNGHVFEVELDAATGALLRAKGPVQLRRGR